MKNLKSFGMTALSCAVGVAGYEGLKLTFRTIAKAIKSDDDKKEKKAS